MKIFSIFKFSLFIFCLIFQTIAVSQTVSSSAASVWAWEVKGKFKTVYLVGELHGFVGPASLRINHELGENIYKKSSAVWIEVPQNTEDKTLPATNLKNRIKTDTWLQTTRLVEQAVYKLSTSNAEKKVKLYKEFITAVDMRDPLGAFFDLLTLQSLKAKTQIPMQLMPQLGLKAYLRRTQKDTTSIKFLNIEAETSVAENWRRHCGDDESDHIVKVGLAYLENTLIPYDQPIQEAFLQPGSDLDSVMQVHMRGEIGDVLTKCTINPRNLEWLPKLINALETDGPPVSFLVGLGHLWGEDGLIALLKKQGYTDIKRIYSVD